MLLQALAIGKYSCETFSTSPRTISVSSTFFIISDASVLIFSSVAITLYGNSNQILSTHLQLLLTYHYPKSFLRIHLKL